MSYFEFIPLSSRLALLSAVLFGFTINLVREGLRSVDPVTGTVIAITTSTLGFWLFSPLFIEFSFWSSPAVWVFASVGLFRPLFTANLSNRGTNYLGPTISQTVASTSPLFALVGSVLWLGERVTLPLLGGTLGIIAGVIMLTWQGRSVKSWSKWALLFPLGAAALRAAAHIITKSGLNILASPYMGTLCAQSVSAPLAITEYVGRGRYRKVNPRAMGVRIFILTGAINSLSVLSLNHALQAGEVVAVSPIVASSPLFTFLFSKLLFRHESLSPNVIAGMLLIVPSVMVITLYR